MIVGEPNESTIMIVSPLPVTPFAYSAGRWYAALSWSGLKQAMPSAFSQPAVVAGPRVGAPGSLIAPGRTVTWAAGAAPAEVGERPPRPGQPRPGRPRLMRGRRDRRC